MRKKRRRGGLGAFVLLLLAALSIKIFSSPQIQSRIKAYAFSNGEDVSTIQGDSESDSPISTQEGSQDGADEQHPEPNDGEGSIIFASETLLLQEEDKHEGPADFTDVSGFNSSDLIIRNETTYEVDFGNLLSLPLLISPDFSDDAPDVLIIHTHGSEAYAPTDVNSYAPSDPDRTEDTNYNIVRVGDEIARVLTNAGINVIHERSLFDYPSYSGCYTRALERINEILEEHPSIQIVLDIHRDALTDSNGDQFRSVCTIDGEDCAQVLLVVGTGEGGLPHPNWQENLKFALQLERIMQVKYDGLVRNLNLRKERFNQHATLGSLIIEIGCTGNTLEEALRTADLFAECAAEVILQTGQPDDSG